MRVLLVEDDPGVREALELGLSLEGHEVRAVDRPEEALGLLSWAEVVVLDVLLPQGDGFSLLRAIRERSEVPVLMLTALDGVEWRVKGLREGADDYLVKPYSLQELLARPGGPGPPGAEARGGPRLQGPPPLPPAHGGLPRGKAPRPLPQGLPPPEGLSPGPGGGPVQGGPDAEGLGEEVEPATLEVHLSALRKALGEPSPIQTVRGYGYRLFLPEG